MFCFVASVLFKSNPARVCRCKPPWRDSGCSTRPSGVRGERTTARCAPPRTRPPPFQRSLPLCTTRKATANTWTGATRTTLNWWRWKWARSHERYNLVAFDDKTRQGWDGIREASLFGAVALMWRRGSKSGWQGERERESHFDYFVEAAWWQCRPAVARLSTSQIYRAGGKEKRL